MVESEKDREEDDDEEVGEDECVYIDLYGDLHSHPCHRYVVEAITNHMVDEEVSI
jgi:hypothetical protein